jgi:hypothetical protein
MTTEKIEKIKKSGRLTLSPFGTLFHYISVFAFGLLTVLATIFIVAQSDHVIDKDSATLTNDDIKIVIGIGLFLTVTFFTLQTIRLKFKADKIYLNREEILKVIVNTGQTFNWTPLHIQETFIQGIIDKYFGYRRQQVTIVISDNEVRINTICLFGEITGHISDQNVTDTFFQNLKRRYYEIEHEKASR